MKNSENESEKRDQEVVKSFKPEKNRQDKYQKKLNAFAIGVTLGLFFLYKITVQLIIAIAALPKDELDSLLEVNKGVDDNFLWMVVFSAGITGVNLLKEFRENGGTWK